MDRLLWVTLLRLWPDWRKTLILFKPDTVIGWHRRGFRLYWKWKSRRGRIGRPGTARGIRELIRDMSNSNVLWGAPRLSGETRTPVRPSVRCSMQPSRKNITNPK
jgi:hypothetical protein